MPEPEFEERFRELLARAIKELDDEDLKRLVEYIEEECDATRVGFFS